MVNTRTDAELLTAVQNALQTLLLQIRVEIREEFRTGSGQSDSGGNPPPVTIHTWLERFNKQKPRSFEKATAPLLEIFKMVNREDLDTNNAFSDLYKEHIIPPKNITTALPDATKTNKRCYASSDE
nr:hypothetical protein [Tanacetum cinerariifolium]